ncbi:acyl-CoA dehydrogenase family protein [Aurantiacibacter rhizosphaerae]|nr:acyl-CoA dehydrogenase family protein [Aurantiacibacter rhizosphaerae]
MTLQLPLSEEQTMLHEMLSRFVSERCDIEARAANLHANPPRRMALWEELCELGVPSALLSPEAGGFGGAPEDLAVVQYALAPGLLVEPILVSVGLCGRMLDAAGRSVEAVAAGEVVYAFAHQEGFDPFNAPQMKADADGDVFVLNGLKPAVRHADVADRLIVSANGPDGTILFDLAKDAAGLTVTPSRQIDAAGSADLHFEGVRVAKKDHLDCDAEAVIEDALLHGLVAIAAEAASLARATNRDTFEYLGLREQFGTKLAQFQALQHMAADMAIAAEEVAAQAHTAVVALGRKASAERNRAILVASLACDAGGRAVGHAAVQLFGGMGVSDETPVSHYARRFAAMRAQFGTTDARAARLAQIEGFGHE